MGSRKEEERNEKIIRGLMKLPPNRRCINCNSLGPQYICTNFWTFICMTCSGIHREFTHRVKSVSMSKFTSQEVEALQNGGNQRLRSHEGETRRASSYHSYSQSPPYDFQYEDRCYGKQTAVLTRKPGSDRGLYVGKMSSFICSPTHLNEKMFEDRFANEGSVSRVSDYSASSGCDLFSTESPNFQKDMGSSSPPIHTPRDNSGENAPHRKIDLFSEENIERDAEGFPHQQRTTSFGSIASFDSNSASVKSYNSGNLPDAVSEPEQGTGTRQDRVPTSPQLSASESCGSFDQFKAPVVPESDASASSPTIDLFQLPAASPTSSINLLEAPLNPAPSLNACQTTQTSPPSSLDLFATASAGNLTPSVTLSSIGSSAKLDQVSSLDTGMQWPPLQNSIAQGSSGPWNNSLLNLQASDDTSSAQDPSNDGIQRAAPYEGLSGLNGLLDIVLEPSYTPPQNPLMEAPQSHTISHKSTNPFDLPYDSDLEPGNMFLDMSSFQSALPNPHLPSPFLGGVTEPWFPQDSATTYIPAVPQGGLAYMAGQAPSPQLANVQAQGSVVSMGGIHLLKGTMGGSIFLSLIQHFSIPVDSITCIILLFNFTIVGVLSVFAGGIPIFLRQGYMVALGIFVAVWFTKLPEWTTWVLLVALAVYDLVAVLAPGGPLKLLVELAQTRDEELPALVYEARPAVSQNMNNHGRSLDLLIGGVSDSGLVEMQAMSDHNVNRNESENFVNSEYSAIPVRNFGNMEGVGNRNDTERSPLVGFSRERHSSSSESSEYSTVVGNQGSETVVDEERSPLVDTLGLGNGREQVRRDASENPMVAIRGIKLGLGDFIFYSVLVGRAAMYDLMTVYACYLAIVSGLGCTLILLSVCRQALPALPISIALGVVFYFLTRLLMEPFIVGMATNLMMF
ncbi:hypothetical protein GH714_022025 [Hevea brasiliensis]|uniref:Arf-GAP domain-containing protein n=1 Tax=Hevea brasiliensis TaxID=3981 RepID=A0A6A6LZL2_HEVBR|nr:hypothetical protein GH714_022025 [Hevea brasiliensis]